ncbi:MAG: hypothetical protein AVDCRST_MAG70-1804 [uncultured Thermomicrobiales bacterium]|uniref:Uncharacterized protein n=1 Tax=uncultured Thermomicrobiales bacterium TaxID=1645740 RepID=A0A6J4UX54_9BACT|nr:MAG: hypothetical protein AVDCRST_MAG70-1804 [uncultured Thermomicrobiales bacterium]
MRIARNLTQCPPTSFALPWSGIPGMARIDVAGPHSGRSGRPPGSVATI